MTLFFGDSTSDKPYLDGSGRPMVGAVLSFFLSGTTVPAPVYDADGFEVEPPFVADENGVIQDLYLDPELTYRVRMHDALGRLVWDVDPYLTDSPLFRSPVYHAVVEGRPVPGARLQFYRVGTTTPKDTYADGREIARHPNPIRADAGGHFPPIYLEGIKVPNDAYEVVPDFEDEYTFPPIESRIVIVGDTAQEAEDRIGRSIDGDEWETAESAPMGDWNAVAYAKEIDVFVAVGDDNNIIRSLDGGRTWEACDVPEIESPRDDWVKVAWVPGAGLGAGRFVAGQLFSSEASGNSFLYSDDGGETWNTASGLSVSFLTNQFAVSPDRVLLAGGRFNTTTSNIVKSIDGGATWSGPFAIPAGSTVNGVLYSPSRGDFVCVNQLSIPRFFTSETGESWSEIVPTTPPSGNAVFLHEVPELGLFTFGASGAMFSSPDLDVWTNVLSTPTFSVRESQYATQAEVLIAVGSALFGGDSIFWSEDGEAWNAASSPPGSETWNGLAVGMEIVPQPGFPIPEAPVITSIDPVSAEINSGAFVLTVHGEKFKANAVVLWDGNERDTTFVSDTELQANILAEDVETAGPANVTVANGPRVSDAAVFTVEPETFYEVFTESGNFDVPAGVTEVDVLLVGGGGGGGSRQGGGGGAGGLRVETSVPVTPEEIIAVTVGAGGPGGAADEGADGENSSFGALEAIGGGGGGGRNGTTAGANGGSGGGGSSNEDGGDGVEGQGNNGGGSTGNAGGGGGGFSEVGQSGSGLNQSAIGGDGGDGVTLESLGWGDAVAEGAPAAVGGGGGGGVPPDAVVEEGGEGGLGGGGNGGFGTTTAPQNGAANTGGGGGAAGGSSASPGAGGDGGSGLVIVRYSNA